MRKFGGTRPEESSDFGGIEMLGFPLIDDSGHASGEVFDGIDGAPGPGRRLYSVPEIGTLTEDSDPTDI